MLSKKEQEKLVVESFLNASNCAHKVEYGPNPPDLELSIYDKKIGCEVTNFFPDNFSEGSRLKKAESFNNRLNEKVSNLIMEVYPIGYSFTIIYNNNLEFKKRFDKEANLLFQKISDKIKSKRITNPTKNVRNVFIKKTDNAKSNIILYEASDYKKPTVDWILPRINKKTVELKNWGNNYDENWLIITCGLYRSSDLTFEELSDIHKLKNPNWSKLILFDFPLEIYIDINAT
jgi:hypothetical protein